MLTPEQVNHFQTYGFVCCRKLLNESYMASLSGAFDAAMRSARGGAECPELSQDERGFSTSRQQVVPFFDYDAESFYPLLDDDRIMAPFGQILGDDFIFTLSEGIIHAGGTAWHTDAVAPEGMTSMRAALYLDPLGTDDGCLSVIPGSHHTPYREALRQTIDHLGIAADAVTARCSIVNEPGDVLFMNHKVYHASLTSRAGRRAIHINCCQNASKSGNLEHYQWLHRFLEGETRSWGRFYSDQLIRTAGLRRRPMIDRALDHGFGDRGPVTHRQDQ